MVQRLLHRTPAQSLLRDPSQPGQAIVSTRPSAFERGPEAQPNFHKLLVQDWQPDADILNKLRRAELRLTLQRRVVLMTLQAYRRRFVDAETLHIATVRAGHPITISSVYRNLAEFEQAHLAHSARVGPRTLFRAVEGAGGPQAQLVCTRCGHAEPLIDDPLWARIVELAGQRGFSLAPSLTWGGLCADCLRSTNSQNLVTACDHGPAADHALSVAGRHA